MEPEPGIEWSGGRAVHDPARRHAERHDRGKRDRRPDVEHGGAARRGRHAKAAAASRRVSKLDVNGTPQLPISTMTRTAPAAALALAGLMAVLRAQQPPPQQPPQPPPQPTDIVTTITGEGGQPPRVAVPEFIALSKDAETVATAKTISQVLFDDLTFEHEFTFIPRDVYTTVPAATSLADIPFARWRELNADGLVIGTVEKTGNGFKVDARMYNVRTRQAAFGKEYTGTANGRLYAHHVADDLHQSVRGLRGVALTRLTFTSDRDGQRISGTVENRGIKEIYIADYDGENQRPVTTGRTLNITPTWSPDARSIAYTSFRRGPGNIFISNIYQGTLEEATKNAGENWLTSWAPDGTRICFSPTR